MSRDDNVYRRIYYTYRDRGGRVGRAKWSN
jgi:hypothetical protein